MSGLNVLLETDLRNNIALVESPLYWMLGKKDSLVPSELAQALQENYQQNNVTLCENSSHAPFISQRDDFIKQLLIIAEEIRHAD